MSYTITWLNLVGLAFGVLIIGIGAFVLYARPRGRINRAFFALALLDGLSSIHFIFWEMAQEPWLQALFNGVYYYHFVAFLFLLLAFGLLFPKPLGGARGRAPIISACLGMGLAVLLTLAVRPEWFWSMRSIGDVPAVVDAAGGRLLFDAFSVLTALVILKLAVEFRNASTKRGRRMAAMFLAGMSIGYGTRFIAGLIHWLNTQPLSTFLGTPALATVTAASLSISTLVFLGVLTYIWAGADETSRQERTLFVGTLFVMGGLVSARFVFSNGFAISQGLGLVAYPLILAYAIVTQEAFDINPQVRNAAAVGAAGAVFAAGFVVGEDFLQDILAAGFLGEVASPVAVQAISAVLAAAINLPIFMGARRLAQRAFSGAVVDPKHLSNLATYRLVLEGALEDGILGARESKALKTLREELGISRREHEEITAQVQASFQDRHAAADDPAHTGDPAEGA